MLRKLLLVVLFGSLLIAPAVFAQTPGETYTSNDGRLSLRYPAGWRVNEQNTALFVTNTDFQSMSTDTRLQPGQVEMTMQAIDTLGLKLTGNTPLELMQGVSDAIKKSGNIGVSFSTPVAITIGKYDAARIASTDKSLRGQFVLFLMDLGQQNYILIAGVTAAGDLGRVEPKILNIAATIEYKAIISGGKGIDTAALTPMTADNGDQLKPLATASLRNAWSSPKAATSLKPSKKLIRQKA